MKKILVATILVMALMSSCIGQKKELTVDEWKEHLSFVNPSADQSSSLVTGFRNVEELPIGTHMVFKIEMEGTFEGMDMPFTMIMGTTISGRETINGVEYTVVDITMDMDMEMDMEDFGGTMTMTFEAKEWLDTTGAPFKMEGTATGKFGEIEVPMLFTMERIGEELYHGHDCWIFEMTQSMEIEGFPASEMKIVQYMDKESYAVVRMISEVLGEEIDTGYIEPEISSFRELQWKLGDRETITTEMGTYDCQIIYLKENDEPGETGETVGTIWAHEDFKAPIKFVYSFEEEGTDVKMTTTLIEYSLGE